MARIYEGKPAGLNVWFGWLERLIYRLSGVNPEQECLEDICSSNDVI